LNNLKTAATDHDQGDIWADDEVELFIDPSNKRESYYQFMINAKGVYWDAYHAGANDPDTTWEPKIEVAASVGKDSWAVELAIPFTAFDRSAKSEAEWAFNVAHMRAATAEFIFWSPVFRDSTHTPEKFGKLTGMPVRALKAEAKKPEEAKK